MTSKEELIEILKQFDSKEDTVSQTLFNVYPQEMAAICLLIDRKNRRQAHLLEALEDLLNAIDPEFAPLYGFGEQYQQAISALAKSKPE
jgi:hypothetical protein